MAQSQGVPLIQLGEKKGPPPVQASLVQNMGIQRYIIQAGFCFKVHCMSKLGFIGGGRVQLGPPLVQAKLHRL